VLHGLPHELECLPQLQKVSEPRVESISDARLPEAQPLPLNPRVDIGPSRWQLYNQPIAIP